MKYQDWKDEKDLETICSKLLDNADMDYEIVSDPLKLKFEFYVVGSDIKVVFECADVQRLDLKKDKDDRPLYLVLEVFVNLNDELGLYTIQIHPELEVLIQCYSFQWKLMNFNEKERSKLYGST